MLQSGLKCYINVAQKNVTTTNAMLKSLDIMSLRYIYIYFSKFGFKLGAFNLNMSFPIMYVHKIDQSGPK